MDKRKEWFLLLQDMGCICCLNTMNIYSEPDIHHILYAGKRTDDFHTLPLCPSHHRLGINNKMFVSRHPWKKEFERRYGTELELLEQVKKKADYLRSLNVKNIPTQKLSKLDVISNAIAKAVAETTPPSS